jgi:hypothetical protein
LKGYGRIVTFYFKTKGEMVKYLLRGVLLTAVLLLAGCGGLDQPSNPTVEGGEVVVSFSPELMKQTLIKAGAADESTTVFGYTAYKIPYITTDEEGIEVAVSGLMIVPTGLPSIVTEQIGLSLVSDDHGTIFANAEAPGVIGEKTSAPDGSAIILTALSGFVTLQPDYIGFGDSNDHYHPYVLKKSLANATVDFIRVARKFAIDNDIKLNGQLFLTGYSEGGYAALATLQKIEQEGLWGEMPVALTAPMAGPYALDIMGQVILNPEGSLSVPSFMANLGYAFAKTYDKILTEVINEPYASKLEDLFSGKYARPEIDPQLTTETLGLFNPALINSFYTDPNNWFKLAMQENDLSTWAPFSGVQFLHCEEDEVIGYGIAEYTKSAMDARGAQHVGLTAVTLPPAQTEAEINMLSHARCGKYAYGTAAYIFNGLRKAAFPQYP